MLTSITAYACYTVKIKKNKPQKNFKQGGAILLRWSWIRLLRGRKGGGGIKEWDFGAEDSNDYNWIN